MLRTQALSEVFLYKKTSMHIAVMTTFLDFENLNRRSDRVYNVCRSEERGLVEANTSSSPDSDAAWYVLD